MPHLLDAPGVNIPARAAPWVDDSLGFSPERALHIIKKNVTPFQGYIIG